VPQLPRHPAERLGERLLRLLGHWNILPRGIVGPSC
jgi:hypothetical protein